MVKELECNPSLRTVVTYVSSLYKTQNGGGDRPTPYYPGKMSGTQYKNKKFGRGLTLIDLGWFVLAVQPLLHGPGDQAVDDASHQAEQHHE